MTAASDQGPNITVGNAYFSPVLSICGQDRLANDCTDHPRRFSFGSSKLESSSASGRVPAIV